MAATSASFAELLRTAVTQPGTISTAYSAFHNYSLGNQLPALGQCLAREIAPGPLATFQGWKDKTGMFARARRRSRSVCQ